jgi:predicted dehydrogenase
MQNVRFGIIGAGGMGNHHLLHLHLIKNATLTAVCDIDETVLQNMASRHSIPGFRDYRELIDSGLVDAVIIATPHYAHTPIAIYAFQKGIHVLCEKPVAVHVKDARAMEKAHAQSKVAFGVMFQFRGVELYKKAKEMITSGEIGKIVRVNYFATDWFRTQAYYNSGGWRATWAGEGGGVLLNQCPHSLDVLQWLAGMPKRITAECKLGKYHQIEVEDEVTGFLEYENGAIGIFAASTGEAPGTSLFEICGDRGKLMLQNGKLYFHRTRVSVDEFTQTATGGFDKPETWEIEVPLNRPNPLGEHQVITQNFVNHVLFQEPLISPGSEGIKGLEIGNALLMSGLKGQPVELPLPADAYAEMLQELIANSRFKKDVKKIAGDDFAKSFHS